MTYLEEYILRLELEIQDLKSKKRSSKIDKEISERILKIAKITNFINHQ